MRQQLKLFLLILFTGTVLSVPFGNYLHVLEHQKNEFPKNIHHQCSDYIHFSFYIQPTLDLDKTELEESAYIAKEIESQYNFIIDKIPHKYLDIRGPPMFFI